MKFGILKNQQFDYFLVSIIVFILSGLIILSPFRDATNYLMVLSLPFLLLIYIIKIEYVLFLFPVLLFINYDIPIFTFAQVIIYLVLIKILFEKEKLVLRLSKELFVPVLIFLGSILPSYLNLTKTSHLIYSQNIVLFFLMIITVNMYLVDKNLIKRLFALFVLFCLFNSVDIILFSHNSATRYFGFSGVSFVDYAGISILFLIIYGLFYTPNKRFLWPVVISALIIFIALLLTQTRNSLITITLSAITSFFVANSLEKDRLVKNKRYLHFILVFLAIISSILIFFLLSSDFQDRFQIGSNISIEEGGSLTGINSFASRLFIWITAFNAFQSSPLIGIGMYTFPLTSLNYSSIDPVLFDLFVKGLSTHITYLTILTEAGVFGIVGFLIMNIFLVIRYYQFLKVTKNNENHKQFVLGLSIYIYILFSMVFSDFWLYGNGILIWAFVFGYMNKNMIVTNNDI